mmetsp:Transcript_38911/g.70184  ORF Transcript_38911/g.70184 Transcript_38911/m.70184 type:complete len:827 (-) Transcript_38911:39-2519(-)
MVARSRRQQPCLGTLLRYGLMLIGVVALCSAMLLWSAHLGQLQGGAIDDHAAHHAANTVADQNLRRLLAESNLPATSPYQLPASNGEQVLPSVAGNGQLSFPAEGPLDAAAAGAWRGVINEAEASEAVSSDDVSGSGDADCQDVHPNADSPDMLHVVFASDASQLEGVQASVASIVESTATPEELTVHIMVQGKWLTDFKEKFGIGTECSGTVTMTGVLIKLHAVDGQLIERAVAKVSKSILKERGQIDTVENFARFYMHLILDGKVVIYLDADTIVQADLADLRKQLLESGKTVGFVAREHPVKMDKFLKKPKDCSFQLGAKWSKLTSLPAYNVGVFAVNLQRWKDQRAAERVEELVRQHNRCGGKLWVGGSQPPLLLAFLNLKPGETEDYIVFDAAWNYDGLGWRKDIKKEKLKTKKVLHWNGNRKPWNSDGLYKDIWAPHRSAFDSLLKPYSAGDPGSAEQSQEVKKDKETEKKEKKPKDQKKSSKEKTTTTLSPEEIAASAACPTVEILDDWTDPGAGKKCTMGKTYGCPEAGSGPGMWTAESCSGLFSVSGQATVCGIDQKACQPGTVPSLQSGSCGLMVLTSYFTTKKDWQRGKFAKATFNKIQKLYQTAVSNGLSVSVIYDSLPDELLTKYSSERFNFVKVNLEEFDSRYGVNDVRYFFFNRLVQQNEDWKAVFIVDAFDVKSGMNPCSGILPGKIYVGGEQDRLRKHPWMKARFSKMGGKYNEWYTKKVTDKMKILNCGLTGGRRDMMLKLLSRMVQVLQDPALAVRKKDSEDINLNMAALNYILYTEFEGKFTYGAPVHSTYKRFEAKRKDVWWIHK